MFGLGLLEIALVAMVAVVLFPPTELPKLARSLARAYGSVRRVADDFRTTVLQDEELSRPVNEIRSAYQETRWQLRQAEEAARRDLSRAQAQVKSVADPIASRKRPAGTVASASSSSSATSTGTPAAADTKTPASSLPPVPTVASPPPADAVSASSASATVRATTASGLASAPTVDPSSQRPGAA